MGIYKEIDLGNERVVQGPDLFVVVKPDGGRYLKELDATLSENNVLIKDVYFIEDWEKVARSIYQKQLDSASRSFYVGFESHIWLCQYLFGNNGLLLTLDTGDLETDLKAKTQIVHDARESFRKKFFASNGTFTIAVNLEKLDGDRFSGSGKVKGILGVVQPEATEPLIEDGSEGVWYRNYFKYIHAPESVEELEFQYSKLLGLDIMNEQNRISKNEWELLKFIRCLTPPSRYKITEHP